MTELSKGAMERVNDPNLGIRIYLILYVDFASYGFNNPLLPVAMLFQLSLSVWTAWLLRRYHSAELYGRDYDSFRYE